MHGSAAREGLHDFGFVAAAERSDRLFMCGYGTQPSIHATETGDAGFAGFGIRIRERADSDALAAQDGCPVEALEAPGGGRVVRLHDPDGFRVEVIRGQEPASRLPTPELLPWNEAARVSRSSEPRRIAPGPSHVLRLGHVVLSVSDFRIDERPVGNTFTGSV